MVGLRGNLRLLGLAVFLVVLFNVDANHYRGGTISWRLKEYETGTNNARAFLELSHRVSWENLAAGAFCTEARTNQRPVVRIEGGEMSCTNGQNNVCPPETGTIFGGRDFICTDYNEGIQWSTGRYTLTIPQSFPVGDNGPFYIGYVGCCWANDITNGDYGLRTMVNLATRIDGEINSSPITSMFPVVRLQRGCTEEIRIPMWDPDGDFLSCRQGTDTNDLSDSCLSLCDVAIPNMVLNPDGENQGTCVIRITVSSSRVHSVVPLVVQDSYTPSGTVLSTSPLQFVLEFYGADDGNCSPGPTFVGNTPTYGISVEAQDVGSNGTIDIVARSSASGLSITNIVTMSPLYTEKSALTAVTGSGNQESSITLTFKNGPEQSELTEIMCFYAVQSNGISGPVRCIFVVFGDDLPPNPCLDEPCGNGGTCTPAVGNSDYTCDCPVGYTGQNCTEEEPNPCLAQPCSNGGTCVPTAGSSDYSCQCPVGYTGTNCTEVTCAQRCYTNIVIEGCYCDEFCTQYDDCCSDFSICVHSPSDNVPGSSTCDGRCYESGAVGGCYCDSLCTFFDDCCTNFYSFCPRPSVENQPGAASCADRCYENGLQGGCYCDLACPFFNDCCSDFAANCIRPPVVDGPGNATCANRCFSSGSQGGCFCDIPCQDFNDCCDDYSSICPRPGSDPCLPSLCVNGDCTPISSNTDYQCNCPSGFMGKNCQNANPCDTSPCQNSATCEPLDQFTDYSCTCTPMFIGRNCETEVEANPCDTPNICQNGGTCMEVPGEPNYRCQCVPGFLGTNCQDEYECPSGRSYAECITECDMQSCQYPNGPPGCNNTDCSEGCKCNDGLLLEDGQCIQSSLCGCTKDGQYYRLAMEFLDENCTEHCQCLSGNTTLCNNFNCSEDASCEREDDQYACQCNEGFTGNGIECIPEEATCRAYDDRVTCIGPQCEMGCFTSPNYPDNYPPSMTIQYVVQAENARFYTVQCEERFEIEDDRDSLYMGPGVPPLVTDLPLEPINPVYRFDGDDAPDRFVVNSNTLWMYFITDRIEQEDGWRCCWKANDPCQSDPCMNDGRCEAREDESYYCVCTGGWSGPRCEIGRAHCGAHGDPHYRSFDGVKYDFQGACKYHLVKYCGDYDSKYFDVIQKNRRPNSNARVSLTNAVYINIFGHEIGLLQEKVLTMDGALAFTPLEYPGIKVVRRGNKLVATFNNSLEVEWNGRSGVDVYISREFSNETCGLCGNMDGSPMDEFRTPDGEIADGPAAFGNSWKLGNCTDDDNTNGEHPCGEGETRPDGPVSARFMQVLTSPTGPFRRCHERIPPSSFIDDFFYDWCATRPDTSSACSNVANYASRCQAFGIEIDQWRAEDFCSLECPENSHYDPCTSACPRTCQEDRPDDFVCSLLCVEGCECNEGHVLDGNGRCVPENSCGCTFEGHYYPRGENFINDDCTQSCTCGDQVSCSPIQCHANAECGNREGVHGCHCNEGFIGNGLTCTDDPCLPNPCNKGKCIHDEGEQAGFHCMCFRGAKGDRCMQARGTCYAHGDPHYRSFDGVKFNYQGGCKYILVQPCDAGQGPRFRVVQKNRKLRDGRRSPAVTEEIYIEVDDVVFKMERNRRLYINGVRARPPVYSPSANVTRRGRRLVLETAFGLEVRWNGRYEVDISLESTYFNNTCGLCSNWNGDRNDEFSPFENPEAFGNSWAVPGDDCESDEEPMPFECSAIARGIVESTCSAIRSPAFEPCTELELADDFFEDCVFDLCETFPDFTNLCTSLAAYADICQESGLPVGLWRSPELCPLDCPTHSQYEPCTSACPPTCLQPQGGDCTLPCVEGCECDEGYVLSGDDCVEVEECGCQGLFYLERGETYTNTDCTEICSCEGANNLQCQPISCHENATCTVRDGDPGCYCDEGFYGNGNQCQRDPCFTKERCSGNGRCRSDGEGNFRCVCRRGWSGRSCDEGMATCSGHGDPHFTSFDGRKFDFQGKCSYILLRTFLEEHNTTLTVVGKHRPAGRNRRVALTEELHIIVDNVIVGLLQGRRVQVNGVTVRTPIEIWLGIFVRRAGKQLIVQTNLDLELEWDGRNTFSIDVSAQYFNRTYGLCGNYDENRGNDFTTPQHTIAEDVNSFGNSWVYGECGEMEPPGDAYNPCRENPHNVDRARDLCGIIRNPEGPFRECHERIPPNDYFESCTYDLCSTLPERGALCEDVAKYADDCKAADVEIGPWRTENFCPLPCPEGSSYSPCASGCPVTCDSIRNPNATDFTVCQLRCQEGCECDEGRVLSDGECVRPEDCGCRFSGVYFAPRETLILAECALRCTCQPDGSVDCDRMVCHENAECALDDGEPHCRCRSPLIGDGVTECRLNPCALEPCRNNGRCRPEGDDDYECECNEFWTGKDCEHRRGVCFVYGSQHYLTFDGAFYSFVGECKYVLARTCGAPGGETFEVIQENMRSTPRSSVIKAIHVQIGNSEFTLGREFRLWVNEQEFVFPWSDGVTSVRVRGRYMVLRSNIGVEVAYDGRWHATVSVDPEFSNRLCGLCGNFDGVWQNDYYIPGSQESVTGTAIGNYFRVDEECAIPVERPFMENGEPCDSVSPEIRRQAQEFCNELVEGPLAPCQRPLNEGAFKNKCMYDACESRLNQPLICLHPLVYVRACIKYGVNPAPWRRVDYCPVECPEGSRYESDASPCPATCVDMIRGRSPRCEGERRVEACQCDEGYFLNGNRCVPGDECGCIYRRYYLRQGYVFTNNDCTSRCVCNRGRVTCNRIRCHENARCVMSNGQRMCRCSEGFRGDGMRCENTGCEGVDCGRGRCVPQDDGGYRCVCPARRGGEHCELEILRCQSYGDPHYRTFSRKRYDFQGECRYYLTRKCRGPGPYFDVIGHNMRSLRNPRVSLTREVWIHIYDLEIGLLQDREVTVNGLEVLPPYRYEDLIHIYIQNRKVVVSTNLTLEVWWDGRNRAAVKLSSNFSNTLCGLCGDMGGELDDEIDTHLDRRNIAAFGDRQTANPEECRSVTEPDVDVECPEEAGDRIRDHCSLLLNNRGPFRRCPAEMREYAYDPCVLDGCALAPDNQVICDTLELITQNCQQAGYDIDLWRSDDFCPMRCPEHSEYKLLADTCQRCCGQPQRPLGFECPHPFEEGCQCEEGYLLDSNDKCVRLEDCGCFDNGSYHLEGEEYYREGCQEICRCHNGEPRCEPIECHTNATCKVDDGDYGCHCEEGYRGNGRHCTEDPCFGNLCRNDAKCMPSDNERGYECYCVGHWKGTFCERALSSCSVSGHTHYDRFDDFGFDFYSSCKFILSQPCTMGSNYFQVILENERDDEFPRLSKIEAVHILLMDKVIVLKKEMEIEVNGQDVYYPFMTDGLLIDRVGKFLKLSTDFGLRVKWNGKDYVDVKLPSDIEGSTCGICGDIKNPSQDFGDYNNITHYFSAWVPQGEECRLPPRPFEPCSEKPCQLQEAVKRCSILSSPHVACPRGWFTVPGVYKCFSVQSFEEGLTFDTAHMQCRSLGAQVYHPNSAREAESFGNATREEDGSYWIGCHNRDENVWRCSGGDYYVNPWDLTGYWPWGLDQPDNGGITNREEDCLMAVDHDEWMDAACTGLATKLICQLETQRDFLAPFRKCFDRLDMLPFYTGCLRSQCASLQDDRLCSSIQGYAHTCYLAGEDVGVWRSRDFCPPKCAENAYFSDCTSPCPATCADPDRACPLECEPSCKCREGFVWQGDECVPKERCGCLMQSLGQFFKPGEVILKPNCTEACLCMPGGRLECHNINCTDNAMCVPTEGNLGYKCQCDPGFQFREGECRSNACADVVCYNEGQCIPLEEGRYTCHCSRGWTGRHCEEEEAWCRVEGTLHFITFDGKLYDFFGDCVYYLTGLCGEGEDPRFWVLLKNERVPLDPEISRIQWVEIHLEELVIRITENSLVLVNGVRKNLPFNSRGTGIRWSGKKVEMHTSFGFGLSWNGYGQVSIRLPGEFKNRTCGLCGNYDGDEDNDLQVKKGNLAENPAEFGNSWVADSEDCTPDNRNATVDDWTRICTDPPPQEVAEFCSNLLDPIGPYCSGDYVEQHKRNCKLDVCYLGNQHGCLYLDAIRSECMSRGGKPQSRERLPEPCMANCPRNSIYKPCVSTCQRSCDDVRDSRSMPCPEQPCVAGCECVEGFVLSDTMCIPESECGCRDREYDNAYYQNGEKFVRRGCKEECRCHDGEIRCMPLECHCEAECRADEYGNYGCFCEKPYIGDGFMCTVDPCYSSPCENDGRCIHIDDRRHACICKPQWTGLNCERSQKVCSVYGNPQHFRTFDGSNYNFFGTCSYILSADCAEKPRFRVVIRNQPVPGRQDLTSVRDVFIHLNMNDTEMMIGFHQRKQLSFNERPIKAPYHYKNITVTSGTHLILKTPIGLTVRWNGFTNVDVFVDTTHLSNLCGLCGNTDGNPDNILTETPNGQRVTTSQDFGNSWIYEPDECQDQGGDLQNACSGDIQLATARELCSFMTRPEGAFAECARQLDTSRFFDDCIFAACASGNPSDRASICSSLLTLETACSDNFLPVGPWRTPVFCAPSCLYGSDFSPRAPACSKTCLEVITNISLPCPFAHQAGCQCEPHHYLSGDSCVPKEDCGCYHSNHYWKPFEKFVSNGCKSVCTCYPGNRVECEEKDCHPNSTCRVRDGELDCYCNRGFQPDGCGSCIANPCFPDPCVNGGECIPISSSEYFCRCPRGRSGQFCEDVEVNCTVSGDPHIKTFDNVRYNFGGECEYILLKNCMDEGTTNVTVTQVTRRSQSNSAVIETQKVVVYFAFGNEYYVIELQKGLSFFVNELQVPVPLIQPWGEVQVSGAWAILSEYRFGVTVRYDGENHIDIFLRGNQGRSCGLCGFYDGDNTNDFLTSTGEMVSDPVVFGNSWRVGTNCSDATEVAHPCGGDNAQEALADNACNIIKNSFGPLRDCFDTILNQPFYDKCIFDVCKTHPDTYTRCAHIRDYAQQCINRGVEIRPEWREQTDCYTDCPSNSHYSSCIGSCTPTCLGRLIHQDSRRCFSYCNDGCECDEGYILSNDRCVPEDQCGCFFEQGSGVIIPVGRSLLMENCTTYCQCLGNGTLACQSVSCHKDAECLIVDGRTQCVCNETLVGNGFECEPNPCNFQPCQNGGTCREINSTHYVCACPLGYGGQDCESATRYCVAYGDPHYRTFDGRYYNFMGECAYDLFRDCNPDPIIRVIQVNQRLADTLYTYMKELIVRHFSFELKLVPDKGVVINDTIQTPPLSAAGGGIVIHQVGNYIVLETVEGYSIKWDSQYSVIIVAPNLREDVQLCGLCGNANGTDEDDFIDGDDATPDTPLAHGNRWRVLEFPCPQEAMRQPDRCDTAFDTELADRTCNPLTSQMAPNLFPGCTEPANIFHSSCRYDICAAPSSAELTRPIACGIIATYAELCQGLDYAVNPWRTHNLCTQECPRNSHYTLCADPCPRTCRDPNGLVGVGCNRLCSEGCTCNDGYYQDGDTCVERDQCGCAYNDGESYLKSSEVYYQNSCTMRCSCTEAFGRVVCVPATCDSNAACQTVDSLEQCVCNSGFVWDGQSCVPEQCSARPCAVSETECIPRPSGNPNYVCNCQDNQRMGLRCDVTAEYTERWACYGANCNPTSFSSSGYPNTSYPNSQRSYYQVWIPGALYFTVTFETPFEIETDGDYLYVGPGFQYPSELADGDLPTREGSQYRLNGFTSPGPIYILGDAVWMYFITNPSRPAAGWSVNVVAGFDDLPGTPLCWDGQETRVSGTMWNYGKCDDCSCTQESVITCSLNATKPISCTENSNCPTGSTCIASDQLPLCLARPCDGMYCDAATIYANCAENPRCALLTITAEILSVPGASLENICSQLIASQEALTTDNCFIFECGLARNSRRKRAARGETIQFDMYLESGSPLDAPTPPSSQAGMTPVDSLALSIYNALNLHRTDGSLPINITEIIYLGPRPQPPSTTEGIVNKVTAQPAETDPSRTIIIAIMAISSVSVVLLVLIMIGVWCRRHGNQTSKKAMTFQITSEEIHTNEIFEMVDPGPAFSRAIPFDDGTGNVDNVYGVKYDLDS